MKIVIAPDSFKESLPAAQVAEAIAQGVLDVVPQAVIDVCPMADGGQGTVEAMISATGGRYITADVFDPLGGPIRARFGILGKVSGPALPGEVGLSAAGKPATDEAPLETQGDVTGVIEMATASGLALVPTHLRDPRRTTTFGTGQLILAALDAGASEIIIGIGGSATVDGGCGCAQALGIKFFNRDGQESLCGLAGGGLADIGRIDMSGRDPRIAGLKIHVACDVTNPLTGSDGAAHVFGPQKGATPEMVAQLDAGLNHLAEVIRQSVGIDIERLSGAGAAGGLGGGLVAFTGAMLERGVELVADAVGLRRRLEGATLCITGEGRLDRSSVFGKTAVGVAKAAAAALPLSVPTICIPGQATDDAPHGLFVGVYPLVAGAVTVTQALGQTASVLRRRAAEAMKEFIRR